MRKLKPAFYTSLIFSTFILLASLLDGGIWLFPIVLMYSLAGNLAYGIPVSFLSDWLTKKLSEGRMFAAGFIHIFFGFLTYFVIDGLAWFAVISAVIFFFVDEWLRGKKMTGVDPVNKRFYLTLVSVVSVVVMVMFFMNWLAVRDQGEIRKNRYLIPQGYEGSVIIFYNMQNRPSLQTTGEFTTIPIEIDRLPTLLRTDIERYGIVQTSTNERGYNGSQSEYFYVDEAGNRTAIRGECIHLSGSGGMNSSDGRDLAYDEFQVTHTDCGEEFFLHGNERYSAQGREIVKYWSDLFD